MKEIKIERMIEEQIPNVVDIAMQCFSGMKDYKKATQWVECNFKAYPRMQYFTAKVDDAIVGYILWVEKGGFRDEAVIELEQIGVYPSYQGNKIGTKLVNNSLKEIENYLQNRNSSLKLVEVTTGTENEAQKLYKNTLNTEPECTMGDFFRGDELVMIARFKK